jgi:uncharacterized alpha/beta hydrolase family protein
MSLKMIITASMATFLLKEKSNVKYTVQCKKRRMENENKAQSITLPTLLVTGYYKHKAARL